MNNLMRLYFSNKTGDWVNINLPGVKIDDLFYLVEFQFHKTEGQLSGEWFISVKGKKESAVFYGIPKQEYKKLLDDYWNSGYKSIKVIEWEKGVDLLILQHENHIFTEWFGLTEEYILESNSKIL